MKSSTKYEQRYVWCDECQTVLGAVSREEEESPFFLESLVKGPFGRPHKVTVLRRFGIRALAGDLTAVEALGRLQEHRASLSN